MQRPITVLGDALLDVHVVPAQPMAPGGDVPAAIRLEPGGQGANVAIRLARRGLAVRLVCATARDRAGEMVRDALVRDGVEIVDVGAERTGAVVVLLDTDGERSMLSQRSPLFEAMTAGGVPTELRETDWLVVSGYALLESSAGPLGTGGAVRRVVVGCALDARVAAGWARRVASLGPDLVILNLDEASTLAGRDGPPAELARRLATRLRALVIVTHRGGAAAATDGDLVEVERPAGVVVDATGAGDAFAAGVVATLSAEPWPAPRERLAAALREAADLATAVTAVRGAQARVPGELGG